MKLPPLSRNLWKYVFWGLIVVFAGIFAMIGPDIGYTDEWIDGRNGEYSLKYFTEGDTTFVDYSKYAKEGYVPHPLRYYGVGVEIIPPLVAKLIPAAERYEFEIRHCLCAIHTLLLILFCGLIGRYLRGYPLGCLIMISVFLTPHIFGYSMIAAKDMPVAMGFVMALYGMIRFLTRLPKFHFWDLFFIATGIAVAMSVRVNGLLGCFYLFVGAMLTILLRKDIRQQLFTKPYTLLWKCLGACLTVCVIGVGIGLCFYPNTFYMGPVQHLRDAFSLVSHFPQRIPLLYNGRLTDSLHLPDHYLLNHIAYTMPLFVYVGLFLCLACAVRVWKKYDKVALLLILFTIVFPVAFVIITDAHIYQGWRHITFFYPGVGILVGIGYYEVFTLLKKKWAQIVYAVLVVAVFSPTVVWLFNNYKYAYSFYNKLIEPYTNYDFESSETACVCAFRWLLKNELADNKDSVMITTKNGNVTYYQQLKQYPNIHVVTNGLRGYSDVDCDYTIVHMTFIPKKVLRTFFPPKGTIHVETLDGKPVCAVVKRNKLDIHGVQEMKRGNYAEGMRLLDSAYQYDPNNFTIWWWMGFGYYLSGEYQKAVQFFDKELALWPSPYHIVPSHMYKGASLFYLKRYSEAIRTLGAVEGNCGNDKPFVFTFLGLSHYNNQDYAKAIPYLQYAVRYYPHLNSMLADCRNKTSAK